MRLDDNLPSVDCYLIDQFLSITGSVIGRFGCQSLVIIDWGLSGAGCRMGRLTKQVSFVYGDV